MLDAIGSAICPRGDESEGHIEALRTYAAGVRSPMSLQSVLIHQRRTIDGDASSCCDGMDISTAILYSNARKSIISSDMEIRDLNAEPKFYDLCSNKNTG
jgi:hypothetical protein